MSRIGNIALDVQEQANELGFDTIQDALDMGYEISTDFKLVPSAKMEEEINRAMDEWEKGIKHEQG